MTHPPITQGLHLATETSTDCWEAFFEEINRLYDDLQRRRAAKQQASAGSPAKTQNAPADQAGA